MPPLVRFLCVAVCAVAALLVCLPIRADDDTKEAKNVKDLEIVTIRPVATTDSKQGLPIFQGISGRNSGAKKISMNKVVIPPGGAAKAHVHKGYESTVYLIRGRVQTFYGEGLKKSVINEAGDFLYIPADLPHKPVNLSATEPAEAIVARTDPNEQESVEHYDEPAELGK